MLSALQCASHGFSRGLRPTPGSSQWIGNIARNIITGTGLEHLRRLPRDGEGDFALPDRELTRPFERILLGARRCSRNSSTNET
jgi:hypothetical protein